MHDNSQIKMDSMEKKSNLLEMPCATKKYRERIFLSILSFFLDCKKNNNKTESHYFEWEQMFNCYLYKKNISNQVISGNLYWYKIEKNQTYGSNECQEL